MSETYQRATARQREILDRLGSTVGYSVDTITDIQYQGDIPVQVSWSDISGTFTRNTVPYLGGVISDSEHTTLKNIRSQAQAAFNIVSQAASSGLNAGVSQIAGEAVQYGVDQVNQLLGTNVNLDPRSLRLMASGLSHAVDSSLAQISQRPTVRFRESRDTRVRISDPSGLITGGILSPLDQTGGSVIFPYTPNISVSYTADYDSASLTHSNYDYMFYKNSGVSEITIDGKFSARNTGEADYMLAATHFFRTATKMFYGNSNPRGLPPVVCRLYGHGEYQFSNVPVVITNMSVVYPEDVDYISTSTGSRVPVLQSLNITAKPLYSRDQATAFSYQGFANGGLVKRGYQ